LLYHWFRQCGLLVGSGVVEASCKTIIGQRLKRSGMHETIAGADGIATLRPGAGILRPPAPSVL